MDIFICYGQMSRISGGELLVRSLRIKIPARGKIYSCNQGNINDAWRSTSACYDEPAFQVRSTLS